MAGRVVAIVWPPAGNGLLAAVPLRHTGQSHYKTRDHVPLGGLWSGSARLSHPNATAGDMTTTIKRPAFLYWGRRGPMLRLARDLADAAWEAGIDCGVSLSRQNAGAADFADLDGVLHDGSNHSILSVGLDPGESGRRSLRGDFHVRSIV